MKTVLEDIGICHKVEYYKSLDLMEVSASQRVIIAVGLAKKPVNSYDVITNSVEQSKVMLEESEHFDIWQAWSRVKDSEEKEKSLVFALDCTVEEYETLTTYGFNRKVGTEPYERNQKNLLKFRLENRELVNF